MFFAAPSLAGGLHTHADDPENGDVPRGSEDEGDKSMKALIRLGAIAAVLTGLATPSSAGLVTGTIPGAVGSNQFIPDLSAGPAIGGYYGAQLYLTGQADITIDWFGGEAGFNNQFRWGGDTLFTHPSGDTTGATPDGTVVKNDVAGGLLPFSFFVPSFGSVLNGSNPDNSGTAPNFFVTFYDLQPGLSHNTPGGPLGGQFVWIFFDDGGGANDDNHDDMGIRLTVTGAEVSAVPEPGTMLLFGGGAAALLARRRRA